MVARVAIAVASGVAGITSPQHLLESFAETDDLDGVVLPADVNAVMAHVFSRVLDLEGSAPGLGS